MIGGGEAGKNGLVRISREKTGLVGRLVRREESSKAGEGASICFCSRYQDRTLVSSVFSLSLFFFLSFLAQHLGTGVRIGCEHETIFSSCQEEEDLSGYIKLI